MRPDLARWAARVLASAGLTLDQAVQVAAENADSEAPPTCVEALREGWAAAQSNENETPA